MGKQTRSLGSNVRPEPVAERVSRRRRVGTVLQRGVRARVSVVDDDDEEIPFDQYQLSPFGVYLFTDFLLCEKERVTLQICLPQTGGAITVEGEVVSANDGVRPGMSIRFTNLTSGWRKVLQDYVARRLNRDDK